MNAERNTLLANNAYEFYPGWKSLIEPLVEICNHEGIDIMQIKEKFGSLRFYVAGTPIVFESVYHEAAIKSGKICPKCGAENQEVRSRDGWYTSICDDCYNNRK